MKGKFKTDHRKSNPGLHMLYTKWAVTHLSAIDECLEKLNAFSNLNMLDITSAMRDEREKLVKTNAAYAEAQEILDSLAKKAER